MTPAGQTGHGQPGRDLDVTRAPGACSRGWFARPRGHKGTGAWVVDFYNGRRRHSTCGMLSPIDYENAVNLEAA